MFAVRWAQQESSVQQGLLEVLLERQALLGLREQQEVRAQQGRSDPLGLRVSLALLVLQDRKEILGLRAKPVRSGQPALSALLVL